MVRVMEEEERPPYSFGLFSFPTIRLSCVFADFLRDLITFIILMRVDVEQVGVSLQECSLNSVQVVWLMQGTGKDLGLTNE